MNATLNETRECKIRKSFKFSGTFVNDRLNVMDIRLAFGKVRITRADQTIKLIDIDTIMIPEAKELQKALILATDILGHWNIYEGFLRNNTREIK